MSTTNRVTWQIIVAQVVVGVLAMAVFYAVDPTQVRAAGYAILCTVPPGMYYAWVLTRTFNPQRLLLQGVLRTVLTMTLMAVAIIKLQVEPLGFFVTFAVMQLAYTVPLLVDRSTGSKLEEGL